MHSLGCLMDDPYIDNTTERSMDEQTRKALELARSAFDAMCPNDYGGWSISKHESNKIDEAIAAIDVALAPAAPVALTWYEGAPPFPQDQEWFIAETIYGGRVVLRSLDEGREHKHTYDFKTADGTYMLTRNIKRWMQFPDCEYLPPAAPAAPVAPAGYLAELVAICRAADAGAGGWVATSRLRELIAAAPVAQPLPSCHVAVIGDRWDSEKLHHVPQLLIEFDPVPANTGNTGKGWVDRDSLAKILKGIGQGGAA